MKSGELACLVGSRIAKRPHFHELKRKTITSPQLYGVSPFLLHGQYMTIRRIRLLIQVKLLSLGCIQNSSLFHEFLITVSRFWLFLTVMCSLHLVYAVVTT